MITADYRIVLASASPRRQELLKYIFEDFEVYPSSVEEPRLALPPEKAVEHLSCIKAEDVSKKCAKNTLILGADTLVYIDGHSLGKPKNDDEAREMLKLLSGKRHDVYTGITIINNSSGKKLSACECTGVYFAQLDIKEIEEYVAAGESADKAGAYGIQGRAAAFVRRIEGCYYNVVGLPIRRVYELFKEII